ncbi:DUF933 domain-containing protein [Thermodesulfobacteriota bacterium]
MKIGFTGMDIPLGKIKYLDENLIALEKKDRPKKVSPFYAEFIGDDFVQADVIVIPQDRILDLLILDMEKVETRMARAEDEEEKALLEKCLKLLEREVPLCDAEWSEDEMALLKGSAPHSLKPVVFPDGDEEINEIVMMALEKADYMFFYTSGPTESHAWLVKKDSDIVSCAARIHTDLARGFIKGDVVGFEDYMDCHNFNACKSTGVAKLVDREYRVRPREIIEIRFNV